MGQTEWTTLNLLGANATFKIQSSQVGNLWQLKTSTNHFAKAKSSRPNWRSPGSFQGKEGPRNTATRPNKAQAEVS